MKKCRDSVNYLINLQLSRAKCNLIWLIRMECEIVLNNPEEAPVYMKKIYNRLVSASELRYIEKQNAKIEI